MEYFSLLGLKKEPFSNSPDPELFYNSFQHKNCLQKLEMALHLRRGLSVVIGDIGTGKSTLSRQLVRQLKRDESKVVAYLVLDPEFTSPQEFLQTIIYTFGISDCDENSEWRMKEAIKNYLFKQGVDNEMIPTLIFDEGQKLPSFCIEILREFLNFETNQHKLLQIIIFAQEEFNQILKDKANFTDRITTLQYLKPLSIQESTKMILFRIRKTQKDPEQKVQIFSRSALVLIHLLTGGSPRKIVMLCSKIVLNMLIKNKKKAGISLVLRSLKETSIMVSSRPAKIVFYLLALSLALTIIFYYLSTDNKPSPIKTPSPPVADTPQQSPQIATLPTKSSVQETDPKIAMPETSIIQIPNILGSLTVEKGASLSKMIAKIYGQYTPERLNSILVLNPNISKPGLIPAGTTISFPNLLIDKFSQEKFIIELSTSNSFKETFDTINRYKEDGPSLIIMPTVQVGKKVTAYAIVLENSFRSIEEAEEAVEKLPPDYQTSTIKHNKPI